MAEFSISRHVLAALALSGEWMNVGQLHAVIDEAENTTVVATACCSLYAANRVERDGTPGKFVYLITDAGKAYLQKKGEPDIETPREAKKPKPLKKGAKSKAAPAARKPATATSASKPPSIHVDAFEANAARSLQLTEAASKALDMPSIVLEARPNEDRMRLAAHVIALWPAPLDQMPADLARRLHESFAAFGPEV